MKLKLFSISFLLVILSCLFEGRALAETWEVNSTDDTVDINPGDGKCDDGNHCSLRAAIMEANAWDGADTIELPANTYTLSLTGSAEDDGETGDLDITEDLTITGAGSSVTIIDANDLDRAFHAFDGIVSLSGVTITNGSTGGDEGQGVLADFDNSSSTLSLQDINFSENGGGISGAALSSTLGNVYIQDSFFTDNRSQLFSVTNTYLEIDNTQFTENENDELASTITNSTTYISNSSFENNLTGGYGMIHISSNSEVIISDSTFENNFSAGASGGVLHISSSIVEVKGSLFIENTGAGYGSAIYVTGSDAELTVSQSTLSDNTTPLRGWGTIYNDGQSVWVLSSTISNNSSGGLGANEGTTWVFNSTISGNTASYGGGFYSDDGTFYISHSTITDNTSYDGGGLYGNSFYLKNTILIGNSSNDCATDATIVSEDYNWFDSAECPSMTASSNDVDEPYDSAYLESLADNGGPTETHAITTDSPAHNAGTCYDLDDDRVSFDQRGHLRIRKCDIGAYEIGPEMKIPTFPLGGGVIIH